MLSLIQILSFIILFGTLTPRSLLLKHGYAVLQTVYLLAVGIKPLCADVHIFIERVNRAVQFCNACVKLYYRG